MRFVNRWLVLTALGVVNTSMLPHFTTLARCLGFTQLPLWLFFGLLTALVISYLVMVEGGKQWFYRRLMRS